MSHLFWGLPSWLLEVSAGLGLAFLFCWALIWSLTFYAKLTPPERSSTAVAWFDGLLVALWSTIFSCLYEAAVDVHGWDTSDVLWRELGIVVLSLLNVLWTLKHPRPRD